MLRDSLVLGEFHIMLVSGAPRACWNEWTASSYSVRLSVLQLVFPVPGFLYLRFGRCRAEICGRSLRVKVRH